MASSASTLPWIWVIEALAGFKQVDASILIGMHGPKYLLQNSDFLLYLSPYFRIVTFCYTFLLISDTVDVVLMLMVSYV